MNKIKMWNKKVKKIYSEQQIIDGLLSWDNDVTKFIIKMNLPKIKSLVIKYNNNILRPKEIFFDGLFEARENIKYGKFKGEASFSTYLYSICKFIALKEFNRIKNLSEISDSYTNENNDNGDTKEIISKLLILLNKLSDKCKKIIKLRYRIEEDELGKKGKRSFAEIAKKFGLKEDTAKQRYHRCKEQLIIMVKQNSYLNAYFKSN